MKATIILSICALILFVHCQTNPTPSIKTQDSIEIVTDTVVINDFCCMSIIGTFPDEQDSGFYKIKYLIQSQQEFDSLITYKCICTKSKINLPSIDFTKYNFVGFRVVSDDSTANVNKTLYRDNINNKFIYKIIVNLKIYKIQPDVLLFQTMNWMMVPKLPKGWTFEFDTINVYHN
ncbi:MAG: hypothetical protein NT007_15755 [Candidatus Kapabacteria bacterium]|nr:hypothetical protein [Candidatus Kapabacteria bacterium]